jgi:hypothetical protein
MGQKYEPDGFLHFIRQKQRLMEKYSGKFTYQPQRVAKTWRCRSGDGQILQLLWRRFVCRGLRPPSCWPANPLTGIFQQAPPDHIALGITILYQWIELS